MFATEDIKVKHTDIYIFLQWILKQKVFTKLTKNVKLDGFGKET